MNTYADVLAFMRIGQPEQCPAALQSLDAPTVTLAILGADGRTLVAMANALKSHDNVLALRARLLLEELGETLVAMEEGNLAEVADGLADLEYVTVGAAIALGIEHDRVWEAVQAANMDKYPACVQCFGRGHIATEHDLRVAVVGEERAYQPGVSEFLQAVATPGDERSALFDLWSVYGQGVRPYINVTLREFRTARQRLAEAKRTRPCAACNGRGRTVLRDAQGKVQKPPGWQAPDIAGLLADQKGRE